MQNKNNNFKRFCSGLTLIELMITLAVFAIVMFVSVSYFSQITTGYRTDVAFRTMRNFSEIARVQAINRKTYVSICQRETDTTCATQNKGWQDGWIMHYHRTSSNSNNIVSPDQIIKIQHKISAVVEIKDNGSSAIKFEPDGQGSPSFTISFCAKDVKSTKYNKAIVYSKGRIRIKTEDEVTCGD